MPNTPLLGLPQITAGQAQPEVTINDAILALESATQGSLGVVFGGAVTITLSEAQFTRSFLFTAGVATAAATLQVPATIAGDPTRRVFAVRNASNFGLTVKSAEAGGAEVVIPNGEARLLAIADNSVLVAAQPGTVVSFLALSDTPKTYAGLAGQALVVGEDEDGLVLVALLETLNELTDVNTTGAANGNVLTYSNGGWVASAPATAATTLLALTDTPDSYDGAANRFVRVNGAGTGVEFVAINQVPTGGTEGQLLIKGVGAAYAWGDSDQTFPDFTGNAGRVLAVKPAEDGTEWIVPAQGGGLQPNTAARQWRVVTTATDAPTYIGYAEIEWRDENGVNLSVGGTPLSSSNIDSIRTIAKAYDGNTTQGDSDGWLTSANDLIGSWGGYDFPGDAAPITLALYPQPGPQYQPSSVRVDYREGTAGEWIEFKSFVLGPRVAGQANLCELQSPLPFVEEAPEDGESYVRKDGGWEPLSSVGGVEEAPADGKVYGRKDGTWVATLYRFGGFFTTTPDASETLMIHVATDAFIIPAQLVGSLVNVGTNPSATTVLTLTRNGNGAASISISAAGVATMTTAGNNPVAVTAGDLLVLTAPAAPNGLANVAFTFKGQ